MRTIFQAFPKQTWFRIAAAFAVFLVPTFLFVQLADEVIEEETLPFDEGVLNWINSFATPELNTLAIVLTDFGGVIGVTVLTVGICALLWSRGMKKRTALLATGVTGAVLLNVLLKTFFQRERPELWERIITETYYSFPSGHAMASSALAISLMVIFWPTRFRWLVVAMALFYMIVVGLTRMYLGVHYPTDILGGWMVSAAWVAVVVVVMNYRSHLVRFLFQRRT